MPLNMTQRFPGIGREEVLEAPQENIKQDIGTPLREEDTDYDDFADEECLDSDMEGSMIHRARSHKIKRITMSERNDKRASQILHGLQMELKLLESGFNSEKEASDPHELYLSSEEDASESADDYEASLLSCDEDESLPSSSRSSRRASQEDTARVVSIRFAGKPQVVEIFLHPQPPQRRSTALIENRMSTLSQERPSPPTHTPGSNYRMSMYSTSSSSSSALSSKSNLNLPVRTSSKMGNASLATAQSYISDGPAPAFLNSDPCPTPSNSDHHEHRTSMLRPLIQRTISAARKRPSMPKINLAYTSGVVAHRSSMNLSRPNTDRGHQRTPTLEELRQEEAESMEREAMEGKAQALNDFSGLKKTTTPSAPASPVISSHRASSLMGFGRRKTTKHRS